MLAPVAAAHSVLISVDPEDGSQLDTAPEQIVLIFNEEVNQTSPPSPSPPVMTGPIA
nr:copper resistance protein CopC [Dietzia lutea]